MTSAARGQAARGWGVRQRTRLVVLAAAAGLAGPSGCHRDRSLGPADSFSVYAPLEEGGGDYCYRANLVIAGIGAERLLAEHSIQEPRAQLAGNKLLVASNRFI